MNRKGFINIVLIIAVVFLISMGGYFIFIKKSGQAPTPPSNSQQLTPTTVTSKTSNEIASWKIFRSDRFGFEVKYPPGYVVENIYEHTHPDQGHIHFYREADYKELLEFRVQDKDGKGEGWAGPVIEFSFYRNTEALTTSDLIKEGYHDFNKNTSYKMTVVAGQQAIKYSWMGIEILVEDSLLFATDEYIVNLSAISVDDDKDLQNDFIAIVSTFKFVKN